MKKTLLLAPLIETSKKGKHITYVISTFFFENIAMEDDEPETTLEAPREKVTATAMVTKETNMCMSITTMAIARELPVATRLKSANGVEATVALAPPEASKFKGDTLDTILKDDKGKNVMGAVYPNVTTDEMV